MTAKPGKAHKAIAELRAWGLKRYPGAHTKSPWPGHMDLAVNDKTFAFLSSDDDPEPGLSCKLPQSSDVALLLPFAKPTEYGLGRSGWVSASFKATDAVPIDLMKDWIEESYRAQAPKKLLAQLDGASGTAKPAAKPAKNKAPAKKAPAKKKKAR